uniref:Uncharacterized protein n=1 Tax=Picea glauca TaxID=3330 RepID=A0A101M4J8_PICGL|nr:hypothetical protein ABT39_MTgene586 [Picea glauca]
MTDCSDKVETKHTRTQKVSDYSARVRRRQTDPSLCATRPPSPIGWMSDFIPYFPIFFHSMPHLLVVSGVIIYTLYTLFIQFI